MSDFSVVATCRKHRIRFCPDDGDCPGCAKERCPDCGALPKYDTEYDDGEEEPSCSCQMRRGQEESLECVFNRAYGRGNMAGAYEGVGIGVGACGVSVSVALLTDPRQAIPLECRALCMQNPGLWKCGFVLGVYSSFEDHEVGSEDREAFEAALVYASKHGFDTGRED